MKTKKGCVHGFEEDDMYKCPKCKPNHSSCKGLAPCTDTPDYWSSKGAESGTNSQQENYSKKNLVCSKPADTSSLSDKIFTSDTKGYVPIPCIAQEDVKEFVKRLLGWAEHFKGKDIHWNWVIGKIKFEAGDELT